MEDLEKKLVYILKEKTPYIQPLFDTADRYLRSYYIGAGVVVQTVWNDLHGYDPGYGIGDADIIFHDEKGTLTEERKLEASLKKRMDDYPFEIDITNEALVHQWYEDKFDQVIEPYPSSEAAIDTWPTTASAIGVKRLVEGSYQVYAPYGLEDLFQMIGRPNKKLITEDIYYKKAHKWESRWPMLKISPW
ncbi:nucleotidyltransferase family protein [Halobacillus sp. H74]|uniref:nucleotidyltransferase family protein n=1 Tax=Halobacillus sp. H74 TaxID=3457436 RepID=UPI003FCEA21B